MGKTYFSLSDNLNFNGKAIKIKANSTEISAKEEKKGRAKIMIGGAVITREYAEEIGADGYSADAAEAVKLAQRLVGGKAAE